MELCLLSPRKPEDPQLDIHRRALSGTQLEAGRCHGVTVAASWADGDLGSRAERVCDLDALLVRLERKQAVEKDFSNTGLRFIAGWCFCLTW